MISSYFDETDIVIDSDQKIRLPSHFLKLLAELLKKTPLRTTGIIIKSTIYLFYSIKRQNYKDIFSFFFIVNYIHWFEIDRLLPFVNKKMRDAANKYIQRSKIYEVIEDRSVFNNKIKFSDIFILRRHFTGPLSVSIIDIKWIMRCYTCTQKNISAKRTKS